MEGNRIGSIFAEHILTGGNRVSGQLISVFDSAANIKTIDNRLFVITNGLVPSPITLNVIQESGPQSFKKFMKFGSIIKGNRDQVVIDDDITIGLRKSKIFENNLRPLTMRSLSNFGGKFDFIFPSLIKLARPGCLLSPDITTRGLLKEQIRLITKNSNKSANDSAFAAFMVCNLSKLCGRGPGYTPAGDDFIAGFLTIFNWCAKCLNFQRIILPEEYLAKTTWMSYKFMKYSQECICDEEIESMLNSVALGRANEYSKKMVSVSSRGHTSGIDLITGMTCALNTLIDRKFGTNSLDKLDSFLRR